MGVAFMRKNPLFDKPEKPAHQIVAAAEVAPKSPVSGKPMVRAMCRDIPVWCDLESRVVVPMFQPD